MSDLRTSNDLKVVLVYPPLTGGVQSLFTFHKNEGIGYKPPLGVMILATYLRSRGFGDVHCLDAQVEHLTPAACAERLARMNPDVVGMTAWTDFWHPVRETARLVRQKLPRCRIVLGGPHCLVYPRESLEYSEADFVISGDGEDTLLGLLEALRDGEEIPDLPGLWHRRNGSVVEPETPIAVVKDLDRIPSPDRTLLPVHKYSSVINPHEYETTMITSRGCPHKCVFCKMHAQKVYARSAERVVEEFKEIADMGISDVQVYDDTFTWSKKRVMDICQGILDAGIDVRWAIRDRVNRADPEMYRLMKQAGCYRIHFGVESGSAPVLKASGKGITLEQAENAVALSKQTGFDTLAFYMFGFLDETPQDAMKTIRFAIKLDTHYAVFAVIIPYPGTKLYDEAMARGIIPYDFWREFTKNPVPDFRIPHLIEQNMDRKALIAMKNKALRRYYFRPKAVLRELRTIGSAKDFKRKFDMAMNIITDNIKPLFDKVFARS